MSGLYRLVDPQGETVVDGDKIGDLKKTMSGLPAGRYHADEISATPLPSEHTPRRWGLLLEPPDFSIMEEPDPWDVRSQAGITALLKP